MHLEDGYNIKIDLPFLLHLTGSTGTGTGSTQCSPEVVSEVLSLVG
jgi:hypothetical protein